MTLRTDKIPEKIVDIEIEKLKPTLDTKLRRLGVQLKKIMKEYE